MAIITGLSGSVTLPSGGGTNYISSVSLSGGSALLEVPHYGGSGWMQRVKGLKDLSGQCVAFLSSDVNPLSAIDGTTGAMTIQWKSGCYITFNAVLGGVTIQGEYAGLNIVTFSFAKNDDVDPVVGWA